jgi:hypothetical protein
MPGDDLWRFVVYCGPIMTIVVPLLRTDGIALQNDNGSSKPAGSCGLLTLPPIHVLFISGKQRCSHPQLPGFAFIGSTSSNAVNIFLDPTPFSSAESRYASLNCNPTTTTRASTNPPFTTLDQLLPIIIAFIVLVSIDSSQHGALHTTSKGIIDSNNPDPEC